MDCARLIVVVIFVQAVDGIRGLVRSRGLVPVSHVTSLLTSPQHELVPFCSRSCLFAVFVVFPLPLPYNSGAAFSFLADAGGWQRWFFTAIAVGASVMILIWLARLTAAEKLQGVALSLILAGALGNFYDRLVLGHVVDFLDFYWGDYHFPAFNIADTAITIGAGLILLDMLLGARKEPKDND